MEEDLSEQKRPGLCEEPARSAGGHKTQTGLANQNTQSTAKPPAPPPAGLGPEPGPGLGPAPSSTTLLC